MGEVVWGNSIAPISYLLVHMIQKDDGLTPLPCRKGGDPG
jgi:hypothetical protein